MADISVLTGLSFDDLGDGSSSSNSSSDAVDPGYSAAAAVAAATATDEEATATVYQQQPAAIQFPPLPVGAPFHVRESAACNLLGNMYAAVTDELATLALSTCVALAADAEPLVRCRIAEQLDGAVVLYEARGLAAEADGALRPMLARLACDRSEKVRAVARARAVSLVRRAYEAGQPPEKVACGGGDLLSALTAKGVGEELRVDALAWITATARLVGEQLLMQQYVPVCVMHSTDAIFRVQKAAAGAIAVLAQCIPPRLAAATLLPPFESLSANEIWGVRHACVEALPTLASALPAAERAGRATDLLVRFATDSSRWVRAQAFVALGPFIATFVEPPPLPDYNGLLWPQHRAGDKEGEGEFLGDGGGLKGEKEKEKEKTWRAS